jgi:fructose/tagatose bisphosphate aldolase
MPLADFKELMDHAEKHKYAVGYFESWNLESLLAAYDAAERLHSPIILGFSGIFLTHHDRVVKDPLELYAGLADEACRQISVPACSLFNESPELSSVLDAIDMGYKMVMFTDEKLSLDEQKKKVGIVVNKAHKKNVAVEGELVSLQGIGRELTDFPDDLKFTTPESAVNFINDTGVDSLAINIGQAHMHGKKEIHLNLKLLEEINRKVKIPLVLHGGSYLNPYDIKSAIEIGIRKINVGSILKKIYFQKIKDITAILNIGSNPYDIVGSGFENDINTQARIAVQQTIEGFIIQYGSKNKA